MNMSLVDEFKQFAFDSRVNEPAFPSSGGTQKFRPVSFTVGCAMSSGFQYIKSARGAVYRRGTIYFSNASGVSVLSRSMVPV